jgi:hypothetical protein
MQFAIGQSNDNQFHRRLVGDDGTELAVSADSFASARETRSARNRRARHSGSATGIGR